MKIIGTDLLFNNSKIYHENNKPKANDINFADGESFQDKLDNGSLKGEKGEQGPKGDTGEQGPIGPQGPAGASGTDVKISVNGEMYSHMDGVITLPEYPNLTTLNAAEKNHKHNEYLSLSNGGTVSGKVKFITETEVASKLSATFLHTNSMSIRTEAYNDDLTNASFTCGKYGDLLINLKTDEQKMFVNDYEVFTKKNKPLAEDIVFSDGETFQNKFDNGSLKGKDGLTTAIFLNGQTYSHSGGTIKLPDLVEIKNGEVESLRTNRLYSNDLRIQKDGGIGGTMTVRLSCSNYGDLEINLEPSSNLLVNNNSVYHTGNKPSAGDIGALPLSGGELTGELFCFAAQKYTKSGLVVRTSGDENGNGSGDTHIGYMGENNDYHHYFRGKGKFNINNEGGLTVTNLIKGEKGMELNHSLYIGIYEDNFRSVTLKRKTNNKNYEARFGISYINGKLASTNSSEMFFGGVVETHDTKQSVARYVLGNKCFVPETDNNKYLGTTTHRWQAAYCTEGKFYTSTKSYKTNINYIDNNQLIIPTINNYDSEIEIKAPKECIIDAIKNTPMTIYNYKSRMNNNPESENVADNPMFIGFIADDLYKNHPQFFDLIGEKGIHERENSEGELVEEIQYDISDISMLGALWVGLQEALKENDILKAEIKQIKENMKQ